MNGSLSVQSAFRAPQRTALLVEDDEGVRRMLERHLERAGFVVRAAAGERDALRLADGADVAIVDLGLAQGTGAAVCEGIRARRATSTMPLVVLTARDDLETKLRLFAAGADDYLTKPFEPLELLARIEATARRTDARTEWRRVGPLEVSDGGDAVLNGTALPLTAAERDVVGRLAASYPGATPHDALRRAPWRRSGTSSDNVIEVVVGRIRKKLVAAGGGIEIHSVRRAGYVFRIVRPRPARSEGMVDQ
ncbi:MAG TPA: response regulator transcription factor [Candidatus Limnocylindria bacterium]|nr:response regulator transcription factor [Candidatus Limnocylindria bacterium]